MTIHKGKIKGFRGSWGSGIGHLLIEDSKTKQVQAIPCDNAPTVRALEACFGNTITNGHAANGRGYIDKVIYWQYDDLGLVLGGFTPANEANSELRALYNKGKRQ